MTTTQPTPDDYLRADQEGVPVEEITARPPEGRQPITDTDD